MFLYLLNWDSVLRHLKHLLPVGSLEIPHLLLCFLRFAIPINCFCHWMVIYLYWDDLIYYFLNWQVTPAITFLLVLLAMSPSIMKAFLKPQPKCIIRWVAYAYTCGFMFGWHVHEKASLHFTIPLGIIAMDSLEDARHYFVLSVGKHLQLLLAILLCRPLTVAFRAYIIVAICMLKAVSF